MARTTSSEQITAHVVTERRTWRTEIFSEFATPYHVCFHREVITKIDGVLSGTPRKAGSLSFRVADEVNRQVSAGGITATVGQIAALVAQLADDLEVEKEEAEEAARVAAAQ